MRRERNVEIDIPDDLEEVIRRGIQAGKERAARRARTGRMVARSVCTVLLAAAVLAGGVRFSPAFAAAVREIPVIGQLVRVFERNQPLVQGGSRDGTGAVKLTMEREGTEEVLRLAFPQKEASRYRAEFFSYPKTVTVTLPGTSGVEVLSEISRAGNTSQYIKGVCQLPVGREKSTVLQLELESDANVEIEEYRDPGSLVIRLTPAEARLDEVYSVRSLSCDGAWLARLAEQYEGRFSRVLRDDAGRFFLEFAQCDTAEAAEALAAESGLLVERRVGNNVPASYPDREDYERSRLLDQYCELLLQAGDEGPVLDFLDRNFAQADAQARDVMLRGLSGLLEDRGEDPNVDWERVAAFYQSEEKTLPDFVQQNMEE